ncbi:MAG: pantothenate kinase [Gammaproteobacteria bacterium RIFCSPLOWO2_02_FULL_38_11]|nr:MAG: pantothenate kinase [Gammaproteobacteria bacterium RIFCSPLOWO2_02_FULL_38_11]OGT77568.1 MAG: pantothenate kinase [Gammaproteobacteria bacterium RIFCSPLOWO2_12_FULL_38_14]
MLLCLDVGNTHIFGGFFDDKQLILRFRYATNLIGTADQFGLFLINILHAHQFSEKNINAVAISSVVPSCDFTINHAIALYFKAPVFFLRAGVKTGLNIQTKNPNEVGADLIAGAIAAVDLFPHKDIIIVDMGTATTLSAINKNKDFLGVSILPGIRLAMESLRNNTAKLMEVDIEKPESYLGRTTRECIQTGLYYSQLGALKEILNGIKKEVFENQMVTMIATGGFSQLYKDQKLFDTISPDLVLHGLYRAYKFNEFTQ